MSGINIHRFRRDRQLDAAKQHGSDGNRASIGRFLKIVIKPMIIYTMIFSPLL